MLTVKVELNDSEDGVEVSLYSGVKAVRFRTYSDPESKDPDVKYVEMQSATDGPEFHVKLEDGRCFVMNEAGKTVHVEYGVPR